ncbi:GAF domain-containing protein [Gordonia desulfuricans]|uniref:GAF domain-containing protein n=1 Tax=Gordonia desulfuricans TaxID=89051 RepID=A0A7K3LJ97_9ACTN|nr:helix-turn-helix domain-containing protein [Gordonia desulfuricans]NDK88290.1 GAF domain-containing protein [Gordonia desulfuricans]
MPNSANRLLRVAAARADFLDSGVQGAAGVPDTVVASWERSHEAGVDVMAPRSEYTEDIDTESLLHRCAQPVLDQLISDIVEMPLVVALTDSRARIVRRIDVSPAVGRLLDRVELAPGFRYAENTVGTNGIGTVLEAGRPISVIGPEHFTEQLQPFACTGSPIIDPVTGRVEGILDISTLTTTWSPVMHALVKSAAKDIGNNLLMDRSQAQQAIFATYLRASARSSRHAVFAFGDAVFMANTNAQNGFDADEQRSIREHATFLMSRTGHTSDTVTMPGGRLVHIRGTRIEIGSAVVGMVVTAEVISRGRRRPVAAQGFGVQRLPSAGVATAATTALAGDLGRTHTSVVTGRSPVWQRACDELRSALEHRRPVVVMGETGTGKFTLAGELFHSLYSGARSVVIDATQADGTQFDGAQFEGARFDADSRVDDVPPLVEEVDEPTLMIVRNIDQCSTDGVERLDALFTQIGAVDGPVWFLATLSDSALDSHLPFRQLLSHFDGSIAVPPLRCRTDDLNAIVSALSAELAGGRSVRFSPEAWRIITHYSWPRNISQLREALDHALHRRPAGEIQATDLPGYCHTVSARTLTPLENAERDMIVAALQNNGGNRVAAATEVGMSRSTLYRKLKSYGITA